MVEDQGHDTEEFDEDEALDEDQQAPEDQAEEKASLAVKINQALGPLLIPFNFIADGIKETFSDFRQNFHPRKGATLAAFIGMALLITLGVWQMNRLDWKIALQETIDQNQTSDPLIITDIPDQVSWDLINYRKGIASGQLLHFKTFEVGPRTHEGEAGAHIYTPMRLDNGDIILVNRGWAPKGHRIVNPYWKNDNVSIEGTIYLPDEPGYFTPKNNPSTDEWYWLDMEAIGKKLGLPTIEPFVLYIDEGFQLDPDEDYPISGQLNKQLRNWHLMYALTWFTLGGVLLIIWIAFSWQAIPAQQVKPKTENGEEDGDGEEISDEELDDLDDMAEDDIDIAELAADPSDAPKKPDSPPKE